MRITTKITLHRGNNLWKSYSKYESPARIFATATPHLVVGRRGGRKKKNRTKSRKKNLGQKHKASVRRTGCLMICPGLCFIKLQRLLYIGHQAYVTTSLCFMKQSPVLCNLNLPESVYYNYHDKSSLSLCS